MTILSILLSLTLFATDGIPPDAAQQARYAEHLFEAGDYQAARLAYKRLRFYDPDTEFRDIADYRIVESYYHQNRPERAAPLFRAFLDAHPNSDLRFHSQLMIGQLHFDEGAYAPARTALFALLHAPVDPEIRAAARYLRGWSYIHTADWNRAIAELRAVKNPEATRLAARLLETTPLPQKSPHIAGWLSTLIPGSGHLYAGKLKEGILAAALSGTFIYLAADAIRERRYVDATGFALVGWQFYWGNRRDAQRFARDSNAHRQRDFIERLKQGKR